MKAGLLDQLAALGWDVVFNEASINEVREMACSDAETDADIGKMHCPRAVSAVNERVSEDVASIIERGHLPLTLGGDHSLVSQQGEVLKAPVTCHSRCALKKHKTQA